jgi:hypothetical protein
LAAGGVSSGVGRRTQRLGIALEHRPMEPQLFVELGGQAVAAKAVAQAIEDL